jgi:hypothetical protein
VSSQSGCDPQTLATDGTVAFTCSATSAGGTTNQPVTVKRDSAPPSPPTFTGITNGASFTTLNVPAANAIGCTATDATSGVVACVVTGHSAAVGSHTLTATATDESGLTSTSALTYTVAAPPAGARGLAFTKRQTIRSVLKKGFKFSATVAADQTTLNATLKDGRKTCGRLKRTRRAGKASLTIKASKACKKRLRKARRAKFTLTLKASGPAVTSATLKKSQTLKR